MKRNQATIHTVNLGSLPEEDLRRELELRQKKREDEARAAKAALNQRILDSKQVLLSLMTHGRTSCSDADPVNYYTTSGRGGHPRCYKCLFMRLEETNIGDYDIAIQIMIKGESEDEP